MHSTKAKKAQVNCDGALSRRLAAYSLMAGAALAFMPTVDGAIIPPSKYSVAGSPVCIYQASLVQSQQVQSLRFRHKRHAGLHVMSTSTCTPTPTPTPTPGE